MKIKVIAILLLVVFLSGCKTIDLTKSETVSGLVKTTHDDFKKITNWRGPSIFNTGNMFIRAWKPDDGDIYYQIYVEHHYQNGWRFYESAYDSNGNKLDVTLIDREVGSCINGCWLSETVGLNVTREYLENSRNNGITFKLSGRGGEEIFSMPAGYINGFLSVAK